MSINRKVERLAGSARADVQRPCDGCSREGKRPLVGIDVARQDCSSTLRLNGIVAVFEQCEAEQGCLLRTLTNTQPVPTTVIVQLLGGEPVQLALLPFQKTGIYPPLVVVDGIYEVFAASAVEQDQNRDTSQRDMQI